MDVENDDDRDMGQPSRRPYVLRETEEWQEQARKALQLRRGGASYDEIAVALGYSRTSKSSAYKLVKRAIAMVFYEDARELARIEGDRLDALQKACWAQAMKGDLNACAMVLKICESRRKLYGLDAPQRVVTDAPTMLADDVDWKAMQADPEAMRFADQFARLAERHAKRPEQQAIEATAEDVTDDDDSQP